MIRYSECRFYAPGHFSSFTVSHVITMIEEIKKHPAIWVRVVSDKDRNEAWQKAAENLIEEFYDLEDTKKKQVVKFLQLKWKYVRDTYVRSIRKNITYRKLGHHLAFLDSVYKPVDWVYKSPAKSKVDIKAPAKSKVDIKAPAKSKVDIVAPAPIRVYHKSSGPSKVKNKSTVPNILKRKSPGLIKIDNANHTGVEMPVISSASSNNVSGQISMRSDRDEILVISNNDENFKLEDFDEESLLHSKITIKTEDSESEDVDDNASDSVNTQDKGPLLHSEIKIKSEDEEHDDNTTGILKSEDEKSPEHSEFTISSDYEHDDINAPGNVESGLGTFTKLLDCQDESASCSNMAENNSVNNLTKDPSDDELSNFSIEVLSPHSTTLQHTFHDFSIEHESQPMDMDTDLPGEEPAVRKVEFKQLPANAAEEKSDNNGIKLIKVGAKWPNNMVKKAESILPTMEVKDVGLQQGKRMYKLMKVDLDEKPRIAIPKLVKISQKRKTKIDLAQKQQPRTKKVQVKQPLSTVSQETSKQANTLLKELLEKETNKNETQQHMAQSLIIIDSEFQKPSSETIANYSTLLSHLGYHQPTTETVHLVADQQTKNTDMGLPKPSVKDTNIETQQPMIDDEELGSNEKRQNKIPPWQTGTIDNVQTVQVIPLVDEDVEFFNQCLPQVRRLDQDQKLLFRAKVQHALTELTREDQQRGRPVVLLPHLYRADQK